MKGQRVFDRDRYRGLGSKMTPQRMAILDYLTGNTSHPSAEDVFRAIRRTFPTLSFATVYNTLDALKKRGMLRELTGDPAKKRFDPDPTPHHHLICTRCRRIVDVRAGYRLQVAERDRAGFEITGSHIEFLGICPACSKGSAAPEQRRSRPQT